MPKRSVSDQEIALIKAMLARDMKNKDIQFFFNRPDRAVNTGRISTIRVGTYSNSAEIAAASDVELDGFIAKFAKDAGAHKAQIPAISTAQALTAAARALFTKRPDGNWYLSNGESQEHECKQLYDPKKITPIVRTIAALANNAGGYIFFGISNKGFCVEGIDKEFVDTDIRQIGPGTRPTSLRASASDDGFRKRSQPILQADSLLGDLFTEHRARVS